jgi:hypothetical protein
MASGTNDTDKAASALAAALYTALTVEAKTVVAKLGPDTLLASLARTKELSTIRHETEQTFIRALGTSNKASKNLFRQHNKLFSENFLAKTKVGENYLTAYFKDSTDFMNQYTGLIDNNNMLAVHLVDKVSLEEMKTSLVLNKALGYKADVQQAFWDRQFAMTGKVDDEMLKKTLAYSKVIEKQTGISSKIINENVGVMMKEISKFGHMSQKEMNKTAAAVAKLGVKMSSVSGIVGQFSSFDSAASSVSKLNQLLGVQVNVMDALSMANQEDGGTANLLMMFKERFDIAGIDIHSLSLPAKRALANIFNVGDINEVEKLFGTASSGFSSFMGDIDSELDKVKPKDTAALLKQAEEDMAKIDHLTKGSQDAAAKALEMSLKQIENVGSTLELAMKKQANKTVRRAASMAATEMSTQAVKVFTEKTKSQIEAQGKLYGQFFLKGLQKYITESGGAVDLLTKMLKINSIVDNKKIKKQQAEVATQMDALSLKDAEIKKAKGTALAAALAAAAPTADPAKIMSAQGDAIHKTATEGVYSQTPTTDEHGAVVSGHRRIAKVDISGHAGAGELISRLESGEIDANLNTAVRDQATATQASELVKAIGKQARGTDGEIKTTVELFYDPSGKLTGRTADGKFVMLGGAPK